MGRIKGQDGLCGWCITPNDIIISPGALQEVIKMMMKFECFIGGCSCQRLDMKWCLGMESCDLLDDTFGITARIESRLKVGAAFNFLQDRRTSS